MTVNPLNGVDWCFFWWLHYLFIRYLSCGSWAGKIFCFVMIIDFLLWRLLQLWQVLPVPTYIESWPYRLIQFSTWYLTFYSFLHPSFFFFLNFSSANRGDWGGAWIYFTPSPRWGNNLKFQLGTKFGVAL